MLITSLDNERIKQIRKLQDRKWRELLGIYFIEGLHLVQEALEVGADLEQIIICPELASEWLQKRIYECRDIPVIHVSADVFHKLAQFSYSQGIAAVARQRWNSLEDVELEEELCWVAVSFVQCPSNMGTLIRLSDSVGGKGIILIEDNRDPHHPTSDPYHPSCVRASLGAIFSQRVVRTDLAEFTGWKAKRGCQLVGTSPAGSVDYRSAVYKPPLILFMGHEWTGLSSEQQEICDMLVSIPMVGRVPSHNVATAAGIVLYEIMARKLPGG